MHADADLVIVVTVSLIANARAKLWATWSYSSHNKNGSWVQSGAVYYQSVGMSQSTHACDLEARDRELSPPQLLHCLPFMPVWILWSGGGWWCVTVYMPWQAVHLSRARPHCYCTHRHFSESQIILDAIILASRWDVATGAVALLCVIDRDLYVSTWSPDRWSRSGQHSAVLSFLMHDPVSILTRLSGTTTPTPFCCNYYVLIYYWGLRAMPCHAMPWARLFIWLWLLLPCDVRVVRSLCMATELRDLFVRVYLLNLLVI
jgi:hypothetical protein